MLKYVLLILLIISYSCNSKKKGAIDTSITSNMSNLKKDLGGKIKPVQHNPHKDDIILALEKAINFCKTAEREEFRKYLGVSKEQINSVSDEEFVTIKEDNSYLYENLITSLRNDKSSFEILSNENDIFEISFTEKSSDGLAVIMKFSYTNNVLMLDRLNTL